MISNIICFGPGEMATALLGLLMFWTGTLVRPYLCYVGTVDGGALARANRLTGKTAGHRPS